jgi:acetyl esterase/lipase
MTAHAGRRKALRPVPKFVFRLMSLLMRFGVLPRPPVANSVAASDLSTSVVIKPDRADQIRSGNVALDSYADVVFSTRTSATGKTNRLRLDIQIPQAAGTRPLVVYIPGGGFMRAPKEATLDLRTFVAEAGFVVASVQYSTMGDQATYKDGIADVKSAIRYLRANATTYRIDPRKVAVWGESAGGYLAAMTGVTNGIRDFDLGDHLDQASDVQAVIVKFGATDVSKIGADFDAETQQKLYSGDNLRKYIGAKPGTGELDLAVASTVANPTTYVKASTPPFLLMHGSQDRLVSPSQTLMLHDALRTAGVDSTRYVLEGANHGDLSFMGDEESGLAWSTNQAMGLIVNFLKQTVGG